MDLRVHIKEKSVGSFVVTLSGSLDTNTYTTLEKNIQKILIKSTRLIILNMEGVSYISSMGIGALFKIVQTVQNQQGEVLLTNLQPQIQKVFETVKALPRSLFKDYSEVDDYLEAVQKRYLDEEKKQNKEL